MNYFFDWSPTKEQQNIRKHRVSFRQAVTVFYDPNQLSVYDEEHSAEEDRWITLGIDSSGVLRVVVHTFEEIDELSCKIRIISARKATNNEVKEYEEMNL